MLRSKADMQSRVADVCDIIVKHAGSRPYVLATMIMERFGLSRRQANRMLAKGRETLLREKTEALADLTSSLPAKLAALWAEAEKKRDRRTRVRLVQLLADLEAATGHGGGDDGEGKTPDFVTFAIMPGDPEEELPCTPVTETTQKPQ